MFRRLTCYLAMLWANVSLQIVSCWSLHQCLCIHVDYRFWMTETGLGQCDNKGCTLYSLVHCRPYITVWHLVHQFWPKIDFLSFLCMALYCHHCETKYEEMAYIYNLPSCEYVHAWYYHGVAQFLGKILWIQFIRVFRSSYNLTTMIEHSFSNCCKVPTQFTIS